MLGYHYICQPLEYYIKVIWFISYRTFSRCAHVHTTLDSLLFIILTNKLSYWNCFFFFWKIQCYVQKFRVEVCCVLSFYSFLLFYTETFQSVENYLANWSSRFSLITFYISITWIFKKSRHFHLTIIWFRIVWTMKFIERFRWRKKKKRR